MFMEIDNNINDAYDIELITYIVDNVVTQKWRVKCFHQQLFSQRDDAIQIAKILKRIADNECDNQIHDMILANAIAFYDINGKQMYDYKNSEYVIKKDSETNKFYVIIMNACSVYFPIFDSYYEAERWIRLKTGYNGAA